MSISAEGYCIKYEAQREWRLKNPERVREIKRHWQKSHLENGRKATQKWRLAHQLQVKEYQRQYRRKIENAARNNEACKRWQKENPEKANASTRRYRAKLLSAKIEYYTMADIIVRDGLKCSLCGKRIQKGARSVDHIIPISLGGDDILSNVQLAHLGCNIRRSNRGPAQMKLNLNEALSEHLKGKRIQAGGEPPMHVSFV